MDNTHTWTEIDNTFSECTHCHIQKATRSAKAGQPCAARAKVKPSQSQMHGRRHHAPISGVIDGFQITLR